MMPGFRFVLIIKTEHQQHPKTADLAIDRLDLFGHRCGRADDPVVPGAILDRDVAVRHIGRMLEIILEAEMAEQRQKVFAHHPAHHVAGRKLPGFLVGVGDEHFAHQSPIRPARLAPGFGGADLHRIPVAADIGRVEVEAHRNEAALAGEL